MSRDGIQKRDTEEHGSTFWSRKLYPLSSAKRRLLHRIECSNSCDNRFVGERSMSNTLQVAAEWQPNCTDGFDNAGMKLQPLAAARPARRAAFVFTPHTRVRPHDVTDPSAENSQQPYTRRLYASKQHGGVFDVDHRRQSCRSIWRKRSYAKANANASTVKASRPSRLVTFKSASFRTSVHEDTAKSDGTSGKRPTLQFEADVFAKTSSQWSLRCASTDDA